MASSEASAYLSVVKWGDEGHYLKEFTQKFSLPQVAKIIKGQYHNIGVPTLPYPFLNQMVFIASAGKKVRVGAQSVKFKDNRGVVPVGPKLAIPDNYNGWFEILSEDGRAMRCLENVGELARVFPKTCLVRENVKVFLSKSEDSDIMSDKTQTIVAGEILVLVNELLKPSHRGKGPGRFLRCLNSQGKTLYLSFEQKGKFSPIAGEDNISGVHSIKNLLSKRLPLMVRLVHGKPPPGLKSSFIPEMRLCSLFEEESAMALPLLKDFNVISIPMNLPLKLQAPCNVENLVKLREYSKLSEKCKKIIQEMSDQIQVIDPIIRKEYKNEGKLHFRYFHNHKHSKRNIPLIRRSFSDPMCMETVKTLITSDQETSSPVDARGIQSGDTKLKEGRQEPDERYDEIDQIYDYVRGFAPLPSKVKTELKTKEQFFGENASSPTCANSPVHTKLDLLPSPQPETITAPGHPEKPEPPPVETIPVRKLSISTEPTTQKITVSIVNKAPSKDKRSSVASKDMSPEEHVYEKVGKTNEEMKGVSTPVHHPRVPVRSNSTGKIGIASGNHAFYNNKNFIKSPSLQKQSNKNRMFKYVKSSPSKEAGMSVHRTTQGKNCRSKSLTTSPLFNIRYKSLTNMEAEFNNTLDSSNSGGKTSSGSEGSKEKEVKHMNRKLPRPKSMTNLFWDVHHLDSCNKYNVIQNEVNNKKNSRKFIAVQESGAPKLIHAAQNKRIGTLYL
ncbi:uncharacterized protein LOC106466368 [Limulus polyphemus]|uniref:Uncharacterized protein LOC106466368 n=1 Tax=Limulus polyphemus TaxID=6850 RepID=A0ABM1BHI2_LIMPO|nr:uncharacterized protein LOC106466368 [Limulus polyphemus]